MPFLRIAHMTRFFDILKSLYINLGIRYLLSKNTRIFQNEYINPMEWVSPNSLWVRIP